MASFLEQVARHYYDLGGIDSRCFVFPNRRSLIFFRNSLFALVKDKPVIVPQMLTVSDLFQKCSERTCADKVNLLLLLYECYKRLNPAAEPLDEFIFWGDVLLSDFDDVDKYLVNVDHLFTNISDLKEMQDDFSYLDPTQLEAVKRFIFHFKGVNAAVADDSDTSDFKLRFLRIWNLLGPLYRDFNDLLASKGLSYEGHSYRELSENEESVSDIFSRNFPGCDKFVFVGLNALSTSEKRVMSRLRNARMAEFCWDYCGKRIRAKQNKSSFFLSENIVDFPQAFELEDVAEDAQFDVISVPSGVGQAKLLPGLLSEISDPGIETAIVIPDENMLIPVLNSIPSDITELNVTMGCPMTGSELWSLMDGVTSLKLRQREKNGECFFYHRSVWKVLSNGLFKNILTDEGMETVNNVRKAAGYYIPATSFQGSDPLLSIVFKPVADEIPAIAAYLREVLGAVASRIRNIPEMAQDLDFAKEYYLAVGRLSNYELDILPATYFKLIRQIASATSVPFRGEPLKGLQIMGPLETRALDFDNVIILNANEGSFPRRSVSASFIPPELRKGFGLPTYEFQDAVWAYYFYRLICRAKHVTMIYDSRTEMSVSGEESRYIRQLELDFKANVHRYVASAPMSAPEPLPEIEKTEADLNEIRQMNLSSSSLQKYLECPAKFYYHSIRHLMPEKEVSESLDSGMVGSAFHAAVEEIYGKCGCITREYLQKFLKKGDSTIRDIVNAKILDQLKIFELSGRNIVYSDIITRYVEKVLESDIDLMDRYGVDKFNLIGTEIVRYFKIGDYKFYGRIDRLDSFVESEIRVVDYKTGKVTEDEIGIDDANADKVVKKLFSASSKDRPKIALQLYLYDLAVAGEAAGRSVVNSIYQPSMLFSQGVRNIEVCSRFTELMDREVRRLLDDISDLSKPWLRTEDQSACEYCDFKTLCGR
ncbi:MAG: PD-(D/E)XK nuclease family protein [Bacteroidales bacterium]|nr:PD-(D/E)XK nuclease family protein [Candidatus Cacconaster equi]